MQEIITLFTIWLVWVKMEMGNKKEEVLERFIYEIKWLGKVAKVVSVHSISSLLVFDNNTIQNLTCYFRFGAGEHVYFSCAGRI